jgi:hypothetical protein
MWRLIFIVGLLAGCTSIQVQPPALSAGGSYVVEINANKNIPVTGTMSPSGNTVPVSAVP